ncbi:hypothetical protein ACFSSC_02410 [Corynebacterium mendelii]|uniref:hypothetical protein n=1 Tax=Corynebacterium mendelii TaxID=2765362 RepID=UPI0036443155
MNDSSNGPGKKKAADLNWGLETPQTPAFTDEWDDDGDSSETAVFPAVDTPAPVAAPAGAAGTRWVEPDMGLPPAAAPPAAPPRGAGKIVLAIAGAAAVFAVVAAVVFLDFGDDEAQPSATTRTVVVDENGDPIVDQADSGADNGTAPAAAPATAAPADRDADTRPRVSVPTGAVDCGREGDFTAFRVTEITSCPFALAVAGAAGGLGEAGFGDLRTVTAFSPVTKKDYEMSCQYVDHGDWQCRGGNNAVVFLRKQ